MMPTKKYIRVMLGPKSMYADECHKGSFIGGDWGMDADLSEKLTDNWRDFNRQCIPIYQEKNPGKSKVAAGLACGMLHTICKGLRIGDIILSPNGSGAYYVGEVSSDYKYVQGDLLPHRRSVKWYQSLIARNDMSEVLKNSSGSIGTISDITKYADEIENLLACNTTPELVTSDVSVEDPTVFAIEKHLEEFLVHNWASTELGQTYDLFTDDGEIAGQQYRTDTGSIDLLAISKDKKELLVVELKKGRASDVAVGQIQRYMGYILSELAELGQSVRGIIIALEDDLKIQRALQVTNNIDFYRYQVSFKLTKG